MEEHPLVGAWRKQSAEACDEAYPADLRFDANGHYRGQPVPPREYTCWDVGTWADDGAGTVRLSTANDRVAAYRWRLDGDRLSFEDETGCRFAYRRALTS